MDCRKTGEMIRALRKEKGMTQRTLAEHLHVSVQAVSKWERGLGCPDVALLADLSRLLGVQAETLVEEFDYKSKVFRLRYAARDCRRLSLESLRESLDILAQADRRLKSTAADKRIVLEETAAKLIVTAKLGRA